MKWNIICDSSCDLFDFENNVENAQYRDVPFYITIDGKEFTDDKTLDTRELVTAIKECKKESATACPSPQSWIEMMDKDSINVLVTISKNLSGSFESARNAIDMFREENPDALAGIVDSCATGPSAVLAVRKIARLIKEGKDIDTVVAETNAFTVRMNTCFALSSFDNLVRNGRMSKLAGVLAKTLEFWGVGVEKEGRIAVKTKVRGKKKALSALLDTMRENGLCGDEVVISHCFNPSMADKLKSEIESSFPNAAVTVMPTRGLNSYYAEDGGVIISY